MKKKLLVLFCILLMAGGLYGCSGGGGGGGTTPQDNNQDPNPDPDPGGDTNPGDSIRNINVTDAQAVFVTGAEGATTKAGKKNAVVKAATDSVDLDPNSIYKVSLDGRLVKVDVRDEDGNALSAGMTRGTFCPVGVRDINSQFMVMYFLDWSGSPEDMEEMENELNQPYTMGNTPSPFGSTIDYLVHKATGLAYKASSSWNETPRLFAAELMRNDEGLYIKVPENSSVQWDNAGNLYTHVIRYGQELDSSIYKIDTENLGGAALTATQCAQGIRTHNPWGGAPCWGGAPWVVDGSGSFIHYLSGDDPKRNYFLNLNTNALVNLDTLVDGSFYEFNPVIGLDRRVYNIVKKGTDESPTSLYRIEMGEDSQPKLTLIKEMPWNEITYMGAHGDRHIVAGRLIYIDADGVTTETKPEEGISIAHTMAHDTFSDVRHIGVMANHIIYFGVHRTTSVDSVLWYDPVTKTGDVFGMGADYNVSQFKVLSLDKVWFKAKRLSDQAVVVGEMDSNGDISIQNVEAAGQPVVVIMEAIHPADFVLIDGDPQDWNMDLQTLSDEAGDGDNGLGDLRYFSEMTTANTFLGMVEYEGLVGDDVTTRILYSTDYAIRIKGGGADLVNLSNNETSSLFSNGGTHASGTVVEFTIPLTAVNGDNAGFQVQEVTTLRETLFGDIDTVSAVRDADLFTLTLEMATLRNEVALEVSLSGDYSLVVAEDGSAAISDGTTETDFDDIAGAVISLPAEDGDDITVQIPASAIGNPIGDITPQETSQGEIQDVLIDTMTP